MDTSHEDDRPLNNKVNASDDITREIHYTEDGNKNKKIKYGIIIGAIIIAVTLIIVLSVTLSGKTSYHDFTGVPPPPPVPAFDFVPPAAT